MCGSSIHRLGTRRWLGTHLPLPTAKSHSLAQSDVRHQPVLDCNVHG